MTPQPKNPTNGDIFRKLDSMDIRIGALESWKIAEDAARKAISDYRLDEQAATKSRQVSQLVKDLLPLIIGLTVLAYALAGHFGTK